MKRRALERHLREHGAEAFDEGANHAKWRGRPMLVSRASLPRLRRRHAGAELCVHLRPWGLVVEVRRGDRAVELERFDWSGAVLPDARIDHAA